MKILLSILISIFIFACNASINETVHIKDGETRDSGIMSVNGGIIIGQDCKVLGDCNTVNGKIKIGKNSIVKSIHSVNGPVYVEDNSIVKGGITTVNGAIKTSANVNIDGDITSVNGRISLDSTRIAGHIETVNGDVVLTSASVVEKDIFIKGKSKWSDEKRYVEIRLEQGSQVLGDIEAEDKQISVTIFLSEDSKILGDVINAEIVYE